MGSETEYSSISRTWRGIWGTILILGLAMALSWGYCQQELATQLYQQNALLKQLNVAQGHYAREVHSANTTCVQALQMVRVGLGLDSRCLGPPDTNTTVMLDPDPQGMGGN